MAQHLHRITAMTSIASPRFERLADVGFVYGSAAAICAVNALVAEISKTNIPVLLVGESGTGKDAYARVIHELSGCKAGLKKVSCAALDAAGIEELKLEFSPSSEARTSQTVFLDGVDELDAACQRELLAMLPDGEPVSETRTSFPRFVCSSSRNLEEEIEAGRFRRDLYFRINGVALRLPTLRERKQDIPALLDFLVRKHSREMGKSAPKLSSTARETLDAYDWPGNIRELENVARKVVVLGNLELALADLRPVAAGVLDTSASRRQSSLKAASRAASLRAERELIQQALERTRWNRKQAARELQISYKSLLNKIKQTRTEEKPERH